MCERVVLGVGVSSSATAQDCLTTASEALAEGWILTAVSTLEGKESQIRPVADALGVPLFVWSAESLRAIVVPNPSARAAAETGTPSVAEASAIAASGGGDLVVPKTGSRGVTVAVACIRD